MAERYLFVTGKLAAPALRATLRAREAAVRLRRRGHEDHGRRADDHGLDRPPARGPARRHADHDPGLLPGRRRRCSREQFDVPAEKGPADLKRLPAFFGQADARSRYGARDIRVFAEINNVPHLDRERIVAAASYYRDAGADVIDLGLSLDRDWLDEGPEVIADLKARGYHAQHRHARPRRRS